jgi:hypothetical protein
MALLPAQRIVIREIQRLHARRAPLNISAVKRSHPKLMERVYKVRPFWGWKRALEDAGLDYAKIYVELRDYVDCKICGRDFGGLGYHLINDHNMTGEDYRREYPGAEMTCETARAKLSLPRSRKRKRTTLPRWEAIWSAEYVLDRMAELHRRNFPMNFDWAHDHEPPLANQAIRYFGPWDEALRQIGLDPERIRLAPPTWRGRSPWRHADKAAIIAQLRRRESAGEPLSWKKIVHTKSGPAFLNRAKRLFGSWSRALAAAGIDPFAGAKAPWPTADKAAILAEIRRRKRARESLRYSKIAAGKWGQPLLKRSEFLFGSWNAALRAAGIEPEGGYSVWAKADKAAILAEIRRRKRAREALVSGQVAKEKWGRGLLQRTTNLFGSWNATLRAAGIEPARENSPWPKADKTAVLAEIRRRKRAGESLQTRKIESEKWGHPLMRRSKALFGSWNAALLAANISVAGRGTKRTAASGRKALPGRPLSARRHRRSKKKARLILN